MSLLENIFGSDEQKLKMDSKVDTMREVSTEGDKIAREDAAKSLGKSDDQTTANILKAALGQITAGDLRNVNIKVNDPQVMVFKNEDPAIKENVEKILKEKDDPKAVQHLINDLIKEAGTNALGKTNDPQASEFVTSFLEDMAFNEEDSRNIDVKVADPQVMIFNKEDPAIKENVKKILKEKDDPKAVQHLIDDLLKEMSTSSLEIKDSRMVEPLRKTTNNKWEIELQNSINQGQVDNLHAFEPLKKAEDDRSEDNSFQKNTKNALRKTKKLMTKIFF